LALKQRADQTAHTETLGWEEEEEGNLSSFFQTDRLPVTSGCSHRLVFMPFPSDDFLGATSSSRLNLTLPLDDSAATPPADPPAPTGTTPLSTVPSPAYERDAALSASSGSVGPPVQVSVRREPVAAELAEKLTEASLEDAAERRPGRRASPLKAQGKVTQPDVTVDATSVRAPASIFKPEPAKAEGPQDLRVFELNSDSGKSTPSNNGKKGEMTWRHDVFHCITFS